MQHPCSSQLSASALRDHVHYPYTADTTRGAAGEDTDLMLGIILDGLIVILLLILDLCITQPTLTHIALSVYLGSSCMRQQFQVAVPVKLFPSVSPGSLPIFWELLSLFSQHNFEDSPNTVTLHLSLQ
jgi:hypothetical protein